MNLKSVFPVYGVADTLEGHIQGLMEEHGAWIDNKYYDNDSVGMVLHASLMALRKNFETGVENVVDNAPKSGYIHIVQNEGKTDMSMKKMVLAGVQNQIEMIQVHIQDIIDDSNSDLTGDDVLVLNSLRRDIRNWRDFQTKFENGVGYDKAMLAEIVELVIEFE